MPVLVTKTIAKNAINRALETDKLLFVTTMKEGVDLDLAKPSDFFNIGTLTLIEKVVTNEKDELVVYIKSIDRYRFLNLEFQEAFATWVASAEVLPDLYDLDEKTEEALLQSLKDISLEILNLIKASAEFKENIKNYKSVAEFTFIVCQNLPIILSKKQEILEIQSIKNRALKVLEMLVEQRELFKINSEMGLVISEKTSRAYRESILREQLKAIKEELGEDTDSTQTIGGEKVTFKDRILKANLPKDVEKIALEQLSRYESMGQQNAEAHVIKNYLELIIALPWNYEDESNIDLEHAEKILDDEHFGLEKVKEHIISHLAVMKLTKNKKGSILLLVGPPGVGKTSLGQSIANSLNRKYVRASLGGVRDDSEIRGHRRTYVGSMPGRIIEGIKRAKSKNPVFILDEIDKLTKGYGGDPAAAMLEVLDPEQNGTFLDHYLDLPFDLSKVFFIATANSLETIPTPLLDRMEIINLSGYTAIEKFQIAKKHLVPKLISEHGLEIEKITLSDDVLKYIIENYTREAGVRDLQRKIAKVLREFSVRIVKATNYEDKIEITINDVEKILGPQKVRAEASLKYSSPGVVTGLAWTPVGGDILFIESLMMPGNGKIQLTGKLGEVMSESAHIALSLVRSRLYSLLNSNGLDFSKLDFHIHVPSGSIPKDGPSAGITLFTALCSLVLGKSVDPKLAMTGEITLRGAVMPVGGIKEKLIAAHRAGIEKVIMSKENEKDLIDVPDIVKSEMKFHFVENINELIAIVFGNLNINIGLGVLISPPSDHNIQAISS
jgi:ATP-dependent Lon protease